MKASEAYLLEPESTSECLGVLKGFYYDHLPEVEDSLWDLQDKNTKAEIKTLKDFDFDGRRCWSLRTVWFEGKPFMITQNAGREGDDHRQRFITDVEVYKKFVDYVKSLTNTQEYYLEDVIEVDEDYPNLINFYGNDLFGNFERY